MSNNIENITAVRDFMLEIGPEHFGMAYWFADLGDNYSIDSADQIDISACGTTACIAGCAALKSGLRSTKQIIEWLGLENDNLFHSSLWDNIGPIGKQAQDMTDYDGALHLLNAAIEGRLVL